MYIYNDGFSHLYISNSFLWCIILLLRYVIFWKKKNVTGNIVLLIQFFCAKLKMESEFLNLHQIIFNWQFKISMLGKIFIIKYIYHFILFFMIKIWFQTKTYSCEFSKKCIVKKIQIESILRALMIQFYFLNYWFLWKLTQFFLFGINFNDKKLKRILK